jgi:hypothetical protein
MENIQIDGREFQIEFFTDKWQEKVVVFYEGLESYTERKYLLFGKKITKTRPKEIFRIYNDPKNSNLSKDWWRKKIREKIKILNRKEEIEKGILI